MKGFSRTNLYNMRAFDEAWSDEESIVQSATGQLGWTHNVALLNKISDRELRQWYARRAVQHGWSVAVLEHQIRTRLHTREGAAPNNLESCLPTQGSDLAREIAKDPLIFDFLLDMYLSSGRFLDHGDDAVVGEDQQNRRGVDWPGIPRYTARSSSQMILF